MTNQVFNVELELYMAPFMFSMLITNSPMKFPLKNLESLLFFLMTDN